MYRLASDLLQPFFMLYLLTGLLLLSLWRKRRENRRRLPILGVCFLLLTLSSIPAVSYLALGSLEWPYPPLKERPDDVQAIVVLAGYVRPSDEVRLQSELGDDTRDRCLRAAELYHQGLPCRVLVSGGIVDGETQRPPCAPLMRDFLVQLGVSTKDVIVEDHSRTTWENAVESRKLLDPLGIHRVVLVSDAAHLFRAVRCFRKQGLDVVPCGCRYRATSLSGRLVNFLPSPGGAGGLQEAWHEWLGTVWYWLQGRI